MSIPDFNASGVLPPHLGSPTAIDQLPPYPTTSLELCQKFGFSPDRREVLRGWLTLRDLLRTCGIVDGFQWLDGSFMEDAEALRGRPPNDIDVVSFLTLLPAPLPSDNFKRINDRDHIKHQLKVNHMVVLLYWQGDLIVEYTRYWCGLFSHRRGDGVWKGMLKVDLNTEAADIEQVII